MQAIKENNIQLKSIKTAVENIEKNIFDINILSLNILASTKEKNILSMASEIRTLAKENKTTLSEIKGLLISNNQIDKLKDLIKSSK